eukprot:5111-Heterococcus_DN1.PRE.1
MLTLSALTTTAHQCCASAASRAARVVCNPRGLSAKDSSIGTPCWESNAQPFDPHAGPEADYAELPGVNHSMNFRILFC